MTIYRKLGYDARLDGVPEEAAQSLSWHCAQEWLEGWRSARSRDVLSGQENAKWTEAWARAHQQAQFPTASWIGV